MIDSVLIIHKEGRREREMHFEPLCKCNETISTASAYSLLWLLKKKWKCSRKKISTVCILRKTQQYPSASQAIIPSTKHRAMITIQLRVKARKIIMAGFCQKLSNAHFGNQSLTPLCSWHCILGCYWHCLHYLFRYFQICCVCSGHAHKLK